MNDWDDYERAPSVEEEILLEAQEWMREVLVCYFKTHNQEGLESALEELAAVLNIPFKWE